ncbi:pyridoxamine 5'-phosphate oxidase family protein [Terrabacter sp. Ter38]|uniref:pyridoxamine 5'-phosphate oxidase family protein n=1 Tax=Terrabacter sp. Ter38 TaxID=2926030 RepID=UPI00211959FA|nr:pyridoxamine 5'-phosphate oxidase family protein [Terrabacter sp. Ter38]
MPLSHVDQALIGDMKQRELHLKSRQRAADAILFGLRRYRKVCVALVGVVGAAAGAGLFLAVNSTLPERPGSWRLMLLNVILGAILGVQLGRSLLRMKWGHRLLARKEGRLRSEYASELHAGRRWRPFYYQDEDISPYVPQILYFIEGEQRFDSVHAALAFAKEHPHRGTTSPSRVLAMFNKVAAQTNLVVVSSADEAGTPSSRLMRFVRSDRPGVWYITTAPHGNKAHAFDTGRIALVTPPTESGATIGSNRVQVRRAEVPFPQVAHLYRAQVPGYVDRLTQDEQQRELVYEVTLQSAKVDTWLEHEIVEFDDPGPSSIQ